MKFDEMGLAPQVMNALKAMGFETATPIQEQAIPLLLKGEDLIGQAQTGTGKTAAFGLPIIERFLHEKPTDHRNFRPRHAMPMALVLVPTRELAVQVSMELAKMGKFAGVHVSALYGGQSMEWQVRSFSRPVDIVVGTPGRLLDHLDRGTLNLAGVHVAVLDEADRMLDMGFVNSITQILGETPKERQTMLFSATLPPAILNIARAYMDEPQKVKVSEDTLTVDRIKQSYIVADAGSRIRYLFGLLAEKKPKLAIIFVRTKRGADKLMHILRDKGFAVAALHGNLGQGQREKAMRDFRDGRLHLMVATDLASRGLDVLEISHVINYDMPEDPMSYVHRIGRTGRAGMEGEAISFVFPDQQKWIYDIMSATGAKIERISVEPDRSPPGPHEQRESRGFTPGRPREQFSERPHPAASHSIGAASRPHALAHEARPHSPPPRPYPTAHEAHPHPPAHESRPQAGGPDAACPHPPAHESRPQAGGPDAARPPMGSHPTARPHGAAHESIGSRALAAHERPRSPSARPRFATYDASRAHASEQEEGRPKTIDGQPVIYGDRPRVHGAREGPHGFSKHPRENPRREGGRSFDRPRREGGFGKPREGGPRREGGFGGHSREGGQRHEGGYGKPRHEGGEGRSFDTPHEGSPRSFGKSRPQRRPRDSGHSWGNSRQERGRPGAHHKRR